MCLYVFSQYACILHKWTWFHMCLLGTEQELKFIQNFTGWCELLAFTLPAGILQPNYRLTTFFIGTSEAFCLFCLLLFEYEHSLIDLPPPWPLFMGPAIVNSISHSPFVFGKDPTSYNSIAALCLLGKVYFVRLKIAIIDCRQTKCCFTLPPMILASN